MAFLKSYQNRLIQPAKHNGDIFNLDELKNQNSISKNTNSQSLNDIAIHVTIEIDNELTEIIKIYPDSNPFQIATEISKKHNIDTYTFNSILDQISQIIKQEFPAKNLKNEISEYTEEDTNKIDDFKTKNSNGTDKKNPNSDESSLKMSKSTMKLDQSLNKTNNYEKFLKEWKDKEDIKIGSRNSNKDKHTLIHERLYQDSKFRQIRKISNKNENRQIIRKESITKQNPNFESYNSKNEYRNFIESTNQKELKECTFSPSINPNSVRIINQNNEFNSNSNNRYQKHQDLFERSKLKQYKINVLSEKFYNFDFKPKLNKTKQYEVNFKERSEIYQKNINEKKEKLIEEYSKFDTKTGRRLFSPKILKNSKSQRNLDTNLGDHMYNYFKKYQNKKNMIETNLKKKIYLDSNTKHTNTSTENIINTQKHQIFKFIFDMIDTDRDQKIKIFNADFKKLPEKIELLLIPIKEYLEDGKNEINQIQFFEFMQMIYMNLGNDERRMLLEFYKNPNKSKPDVKKSMNRQKSSIF